MDVRRCVCIWWVDYSGVVSYGWAGIRLAGLLTVRQSLGLFLAFSVYYGTLNVLFFRLFLDDSLMCILFFIEIVYCLWRLSVNDHTGKEYATLTQPQAIQEEYKEIR